jgi:hypothetical protein
MFHGVGLAGGVVFCRPCYILAGQFSFLIALDYFPVSSVIQLA